MARFMATITSASQMSDRILFFSMKRNVYIWPISIRTRTRAARVPSHLKLDVMDLHNRSRIEPGHASQRRRPDENSRTEIKFIAVHWHSLCTYIQTHARKVKRREHFDCLGAALVLMWDQVLYK